MQGSGREIVRGSASCGFGPIGPESWPNGAVAQISSSNSLQQVTNVCGACIEVGLHATCLLLRQAFLVKPATGKACAELHVMLQVRSAEASTAVQVQLIDISTSLSADEIGLLQPQLWTLSNGQVSQSDAEPFSISYRQVSRPAGANHLNEILCLSAKRSSHAASHIMQHVFSQPAFPWHLYGLFARHASKPI